METLLPVLCDTPRGSQPPASETTSLICKQRLHNSVFPCSLIQTQKKKRCCMKLSGVISRTESRLYPLEETCHAVQMTYSLIFKAKDLYCMNNFHLDLTSAVELHL